MPGGRAALLAAENVGGKFPRFDEPPTLEDKGIDKDLVKAARKAGL